MSVSPSRRSGLLPERLRLPPLWSVAVALLAAGVIVAWELANGGSRHTPGIALHFLLWPGAAVFVSVYIFAWLGWALDID